MAREQVVKEMKDNPENYSTLNSLLLFLIVYHDITEDCRKKDINDDRNISILVQLVELAQKLIKSENQYQKYANDFKALLNPERDGLIVSSIKNAQNTVL